MPFTIKKNNKNILITIKVLTWLLILVVIKLMFFGGIKVTISVNHFKNPLFFLALLLSIRYFWDEKFKVKITSFCDKYISNELIFWVVFSLYCVLFVGFEWDNRFLPKRLNNPAVYLLIFIVGRYFFLKKDINAELKIISDRFIENNHAIWAMVLIYTVLFVAFKVFQHLSFRTGAYDLAMYDYAISNTIKGRFMFTPFLDQGSYFGEHFSPILLFFVPLYKLFNTPLVLVTLEGLFVGLAAIPLYYFIVEISEDKCLALFVSFLYLNSNFILLGLAFDFHQEMLWPFFLFSCFYFFYKKKDIPYFIFLILALAIKEDIGIYMFFAGLYFATLGGEKRRGTITCIISIVWAIVSFKVIVPYFYNDPTVVSSRLLNERYSHLGSSYSGIISNLLAHPKLILDGIFHVSFNKTLSELLWLPLLDPIFLLAIPPLLVNTLSSYDMQYNLSVYYAVPLVGFLHIAAGSGLKRIVGKIGNKKFILFFIILFFKYENFIGIPKVRFTFPLERDLYGLNLINEIPQNTFYSAQTTLIPHIQKNNKVVLFPNNYETANYIFLDTKRITWPIGDQEYNKLLSKLRGSKNFALIHDKNGFLLFKNTQIKKR